MGSHGTTYGGNPLAGAVGGKVMELINRPEVLAGVAERHRWFVDGLNAINQRLQLFSEIRGLGLLIGCVLNQDYSGKAKLINQAAAREGLMVLIAGASVVRFAPSLIITREEVEEGLARFERACLAVTEGARA